LLPSDVRSAGQTVSDDADVITCVVDYTIDPSENEAFERFATEWIRLVDAHGGTPPRLLPAGRGLQ
jgi:hypothetical protein